MSKNKIYMILIVLLILLLGLATATATSIDNTTDTMITKNTEKNIETSTDTIDKPVKTRDTTKTNTSNKVSDANTGINGTKSIKKMDKSSFKSAPDLKDLTVYTDDIVARHGDIVTITMYSDPVVSDGIVTWFVENYIPAIHNLSYQSNSIEFDTSSLDPGVNSIYIDYGVSEEYLEAACSATLTLYKNITVDTDSTMLYSNEHTPNPSITISTADSYARGKIDLYINNSLVKTYNDVNYNNYNVVFDDDIVGSLADGVYDWRLNFTPTNSYVSSNNLTGTLERINKIKILLTDMTVYYDEVTPIPVTLTPQLTEGLLVYIVDDETICAYNLSIRSDYNIDFDSYAYAIGDHEFMVELRSTIYGSITNTSTLTVINRPASIGDVNASINKDTHNMDVTVRLTSDGSPFTRSYEGRIKVYNASSLVYTSDDLSSLPVGGDILISLPAAYNNQLLRFEYAGDYRYDNADKNVLVSAKKLPITMTSNTITANVCDLVSIPFAFNDSVVDGFVSVSYGGSIDNITGITGTTRSIGFDSTDYLQGEYELELEYYDSNIYEDASTTLTLYLYQPTSITADKNELDVTLGEGNEYTVDFTTSLDQWNDVIWGSIDIYIDDNIIDTIVIDDTTANTGSITLDDYNMEDVTPGLHTLRAVFTTDDPYITTSNTRVNLNVGGRVILELPENPVAMIKENFVMPVNITFNGKIINTGNITWYFENEDVRHANLTRDNHREFTRYINDNVGLYNITIEYKDYDNIYPTATNSTLLLVRSNTTIKATTIRSYVKNTTIYLRLLDDNNKVFNGLVNATLPDGTVIENVECSLGNLFIKDLPLGENDIIISYPESQYYKAATITHRVNVTKSNTKNMNFLENDTAGNVTLEVWVYDYYDTDTYPSGEVEIIDKATGEIVGRIPSITSKNTNVTLNIDKIGEYELSIEYKGSMYHNPVNNTKTITVVGRASETVVTVNNSTFGNTTIEVTVKDPETNQIINNAPITVTLPDGRSITSNTGSTGTINITLDIPVGQNMITVEFNGDDTYNTSTKSITVTVTQRQSTTTATITNSSVGNVTVEVTVTDKDTGQSITSGEVEILDKDGNKVGTGTLNSTGKATIITTINNKDITELTVNYMGNTNYTGSTYTIDDLVVVGRLSDINYTVNNNTHANISVNVTVIDPVTNTIVPNSEITITYPDGITETVTTDDNGNYTITHDLPVGDNTITVEFTGTDTYNSTTKTLTVTVQMRESNTTATIINNTVQNTTISVTVTDQTTGNPVLYGDVEIVNIDTREVIGRGTLNGTNNIQITSNIDTTGTYHLRADFKGNNNYTSSNYTLPEFDVEKRASQTSIIVTSDVYQDTTINITVSDPITGTPIANAPVTITLPDGETINRLTDPNGNITVDLDLPVGQNTITVTYTGNDEYNTSTQTQTINVVKRASETIARVTNATIRNTTIEVTVTDSTNDEPVTSGEIIIKDKDTSEIVGRGTLSGTNNILINTSINSKGTYNLLVEYQGNNYYNSSIYTLNDITVTGRQATIETRINNQTQGNTNITVTLKDPVTDTPIPNAPITITLPDGSTQTLTTDNNGNITIKPNLPVGPNTITITYPGNEEYNTTSTTVTLNVDMRESLTTGTLKNNTVRNTTITVTVTDKTTGQSITSGQIELINKNTGALIATGTLTGTNSITIPVNLPSGTYNITVNYLGNANYTPSQDTLNNIRIEKRESSISILTLNDTIDDTRINITIKDTITGETITNAPVTITLPDATTINTHTGTTGTITQTLTLPAGDNTITVTYDGNNQYNTSTQTHNIDVKKLESKITVTRQTAHIGDTITLTATITDKNNKALTGGKVAFKLNGVTLKDERGEVIYANVTGGSATITYHVPSTYQPKTYKISAVYSGNNQYNESRSNTPLLTLKQRQATLTITNNKEVKVGENLTIHVNITDKQDKTRQVNGNIILKINGITLKDTNGETLQIPIHDNKADYNYTIGTEYSIRKHTITAVLINNTYTRSQANQTFNLTTTTTQINLNTLTMTPKTSTILTGTITDNNGNNIKGINKVAVKIDGTTIKNEAGKPQYYYINDGQINIQLEDKNYNEGTHNIEVVTGARSSYTGARNNTTLTIPNNTLTKNSNTNTMKTATITTRQLVNIIPEKQIALIGETNTITLQIKDTNNKNIPQGTVTFKQNGKTIATAPVTNGKATLKHKYNKTGTYQITATYTDNKETYTKTIKTFTIQIIKQPTTTIRIHANNTNTPVGETLTLTTLFTDQHNNKIPTATATITIQNKTTTTKINNGISITPITLNKAGKYNITITLNQTTITRQITVTKKTPKIKITTQLLTPGQKNTLTVQATTTDGVPLNEGKIQWKINGITQKNSKGQTIQTTITDGTSTITYQIPTTWAGKQVNITSTYTGSANYQIKKTTRNISIPQATATATITLPTKIQTRDNITIKIKITDKNTLKPVTGTTKIAIKINGKTITTPKITNGQYTLQYKLPILKTNNTQKITVVYANKNYKRLDAHKTFKIQPINTTITLKDQKIQRGQTLHIKTYIKDTHGEIMKRNDTYCIKLNGKTILTKKLNNGLMDFKLPINHKKKTYNMTIKTGNNHYYNGLNKTIKLTIT